MLDTLWTSDVPITSPAHIAIVELGVGFVCVYGGGGQRFPLHTHTQINTHPHHYQPPAPTSFHHDEDMIRTVDAVHRVNTSGWRRMLDGSGWQSKYRVRYTNV